MKLQMQVQGPGIGFTTGADKVVDTDTGTGAGINTIAYADQGAVEEGGGKMYLCIGG